MQILDSRSLVVTKLTECDSLPDLLQISKKKDNKFPEYILARPKTDSWWSMNEYTQLRENIQQRRADKKLYKPQVKPKYISQAVKHPNTVDIATKMNKKRPNTQATLTCMTAENIISQIPFWETTVLKSASKRPQSSVPHFTDYKTFEMPRRRGYSDVPKPSSSLKSPEYFDIPITLSTISPLPNINVVKTS